MTGVLACWDCCSSVYLRASSCWVLCQCKHWQCARRTGWTQQLVRQTLAVFVPQFTWPLVTWLHKTATCYSWMMLTCDVCWFGLP
jgi:alkylhydroperoxidase/carboxymuconolactone decarboxylase family protein YurZ